jgi:2-keto-4-pentenoate hydratase/2-oxohepta-3-ene-1,7-dioic acid hydratase in catechol pathway
MILKSAIVVLIILSIGSYYLFRPISTKPTPANFVCMNQSEGDFFVSETKPIHIYGIGLSYAKHIEETASEFDPNALPVVFRKDLITLCDTKEGVKYPTSEEVISHAEKWEVGLGKKIEENHPNISPLLDYEAELGFILLEDIQKEQINDPSFVPKIGFFIANDLSSRSLAVLGEGMVNRYEYWGMSKSFPNFLPVSEKIWIPKNFVENAIPCVSLKTIVNGEERQNEKSNGMIFTPKMMLYSILQTYPRDTLKKGDRVIMGTPGGVALVTPRWKVRLANLLGFNRFTKLKLVLKSENNRFLKPGDKVIISGDWLGEVETTILK